MAEPKKSTSQVRDSDRNSEDSQEQPETIQVSDAAEVQQPRRSQRPRTLTEKGKGMQTEKLIALQQRFSYI